MSWHRQSGWDIDLEGEGIVNAPQAALEMGHDMGTVGRRDRAGLRGGTPPFKS